MASITQSAVFGKTAAFSKAKVAKRCVRRSRRALERDPDRVTRSAGERIGESRATSFGGGGGARDRALGPRARAWRGEDFDAFNARARGVIRRRATRDGAHREASRSRDLRPNPD